MPFDYKALLEAVDTPAIVLQSVIQKLLGNYLTWEPESIWLELEHRGIVLPEANCAKVMAAIALQLVPSFYWDATVYEKTAIALDGHAPHPGIIEEATPAQLAWAVVEAAWLLRLTNNASWEYGHEVRGYTGVILARAGFVCAPDELRFAEKQLARENKASELCATVQQRWHALDATQLEHLTLTESPVDIQLARLASVALHVQQMRARVVRDLQR